MPVHALGAIIDRHVRRDGFSVIRDLTGHGVGRTIHEPPEVPNYDPGGRSPLLTDGLVIAVEPLVAERSGAVRVDRRPLDDRHARRRLDRPLGAHHRRHARGRAGADGAVARRHHALH